MYKGASREGDRASALLKQREKEREELEAKKAALARDMERSTKDMNSKFSSTMDDVESRLRAKTYGLVTLEQMKKAQEAVVVEIQAAQAPKAQEVKRKKVQDKVVVSFSMEDEEEDSEAVASTACKSKNGGAQGGAGAGATGKTEAAHSPAVAAAAGAAAGAGVPEGAAQIEKRAGEADAESGGGGGVKKVKLGKDPGVDTSFLPDREREQREQEQRQKLEAEWQEMQRKTKDEVITITYSYWDGSGHRRTIHMKKGNTVMEMLQACLVDLRKEFSELRGISAENLMLVKEDLIIPTSYSFYDFYVTKARGKSGPLFNFGAYEDVRLVNDGALEKDEAHAAKVMLRSWYERNKHIFPASRWEAYDPAKKWDKYTIKDTGLKAP